MIGPATIGCTVWAALPSASSTPWPVTRVGTEPNIAQIRPAAMMTVSDATIMRIAGGMRTMRSVS